MKKVITIVFLLLIFALFGGAYFLLHKENSNPYQTQTSTEEQNPDDIDGDGLLNWQEELYGTSVRLRDTDGDRVSDFEEVAKGFNPLVYGEGLTQEEVIPQAEIYEEPTIVFQDNTNSQQNNTFTEGFTPVVGQEIDPELRSTLNLLGQAIQSSYSKDTQDTELFGKLFSQELELEEDTSRLRGALGTYRRVGLQISNLDHSQLNLEMRNLENRYLEIAESMEVLLDSQEIEKQEYYQKVLLFNASAYALQEDILSVHNYVKGNQITFEKSEPGAFFLFSLNE